MNLSTLDISKNTNLETFCCRNNHLKYIDTSNNTKLKDVGIEDQNLILETDSHKNLSTAYRFSIDLKVFMPKKLISNISSVTAYFSDDAGISSSFDSSTGILYLSAPPTKIDYVYTVKYNSNTKVSSFTAESSILFSMSSDILPDTEVKDISKELKSYKINVKQ